MFETVVDVVVRNLPDPFVFSYASGILILMFFAEERLDAPLRGARGKKKGSDTEARFADFIQNLPPSSLRVRRYFAVAWMIYCLGLVLVFTMLCFAVALAVETASPEQAGLNKMLTISPGAEAARVGSTLADTAGQIFPVSTIAPNHPWQPILIALAMSGVLPVVPRIRQTEQRIRRLSLRAAGFPSHVFRLWKSLDQTALGFPDTMKVLDDTAVYEKADEYFQMLGGASTKKNEDFREALAVIAGFRAWTADPERFPDDDVRQLFDSAAPRDLETDVGFLMNDLGYQVRLSEALVGRDTPRPDAADAAGMAEAPVQFARARSGAQPPPERNQNIARAKDTLSARWVELADKTIDEGKVCRLLIALYAERAPRMVGTAPKTVLLRDWITKARDRMNAGSASLNYFMFSGMMGLLTACLLLYVGVFHWCVSLVWGFDLSAITGGSVSIRADAIAQMRTAAWSAVFLFLPAAMPLFMFREVWVGEARWKYWVTFFDPPLLQYLLFFASAVAMSAVFQMLYLFLEPLIVPGSQRGLSRIDEFITLSTVETALVRGLSGGMLATVIASALDQRFRKDTWYWPNWSIIILFAAGAIPLTLSAMPGADIVWWSADRLSREGVSRAMLFDTYLDIAVLSAVGIFMLVMMTLYAWNKLRHSQRAAAGQTAAAVAQDEAEAA